MEIDLNRSLKSRNCNNENFNCYIIDETIKENEA